MWQPPGTGYSVPDFSRGCLVTIVAVTLVILLIVALIILLAITLVV